jgi:glycosyltransferase involved in cell wall biosynthesis
MGTTLPLVTAVIPTRNRPELVTRAIHSALAQTYSRVEVVVVVDGNDPATMAALAQLNNERVRCVLLSESVGGSEARNIGVRKGRGEWIAFLDDDDTWMPEKIEKQVRAAGERAERGAQIVCSQVIARTAEGDMVLPEKAPRKPYSEYLLVRSRLTFGEGLMQTSTLLARREHLLRMPFSKGLRKHQDWDWILRCAEEQGLQVIFVPEPLAVWYVDDMRARVSQVNAWRSSLEWIRSSRMRVTKRAYASFVATYVAPQAAIEGSWKTCWMLLNEMWRMGNPRLRDIVVFAGAWLFPSKLRQKLRSFLRGREASSTVREIAQTS